MCVYIYSENVSGWNQYNKNRSLRKNSGPPSINNYPSSPKYQKYVPTVDIMGLLGDTDIPFYAREIKSEILYLKIYHSNSKFNRTEIVRLP